MTSVLNVDTIAAKDGTSAATLTKQTAAKMFVNINGSSGTPTARDSFNVSSITDLNTGRYAPVLTNAMSDTNYSHSGNSNFNTGDTFSSPANLAIAISNVTATTTSTYEATNYIAGSVNNYSDSKYVSLQVFGDLA